MGLDVYLYHCPDRKTAKEAEDKVREYRDRLWEESGPYDSPQKDEIHAKVKTFAESLGCTGEDETHRDVTSINLPSVKYPEHLFKIGYFRSSYNPGGINRILRNLRLPDLGEIMGRPEAEYEFTPDWKAARKAAKDTLAKYKKATKADGGLLQIISVYPPFSADKLGPTTEAEALELYREEALKGRDPVFADGSGWSNSKGHFYPSGLEVLGVMPVMPGSASPFGGVTPCTYVVTRTKTKDDWYAQALHIVIETCEYVLGTQDPENYFIHWSS